MLSKPKTLKEIETMIDEIATIEETNDFKEWIKKIMRSWNIVLETFEAIQTHQITLLNRVNDRVEGLRNENVILNQKQKALIELADKMRVDIDYIFDFFQRNKDTIKYNKELVERKKTEMRGIE